MIDETDVESSNSQRYKLGLTTPLLKCLRTLTSGKNNQEKALVKILLYHEISDKKLHLFKQQIENLNKKYSFITPEKFQDFLNNKITLTGLNLLITFDDGFLSSKFAAENVLEPLGIKAMFFIPSGFIGLKKNWEEFVGKKINDGSPGCKVGAEHEPMGWDDVCWLKEHGNVIGSHTVNHTRLSTLNNDELEYELFESANILNKFTGASIETIAYPFGDIESINKKSMKVIQKYYSFCYSGFRGFNKKTVFPLAILRDEIALNYPVNYVEFIVENGLAFLYYRKAEKLSKLTI